MNMGIATDCKWWVFSATTQVWRTHRLCFESKAAVMSWYSLTSAFAATSIRLIPSYMVWSVLNTGDQWWPNRVPLQSRGVGFQTWDPTANKNRRISKALVDEDPPITFRLIHMVGYTRTPASIWSYIFVYILYMKCFWEGQLSWTPLGTEDPNPKSRTW